LVQETSYEIDLDILHNPKYYSKTPKISNDIKRPLWSVVIPTYNCAQFLKQTLKSVLAQAPGETLMEIIVVDDHSTKDDPEAVVNEYGKGRVQFYGQPKNIGKSSNYGFGINLSKGHYIHLLHGDDTVELGFYKTIADLFKEQPKASAVFCRCNYINADNRKIGETELLIPKSGIINNFIERITVWQLIQPPSVVFKREVYEDLGGYDIRLEYIEDWEFYVRVALNYKFIYTPEILANYRIFSENSSSKSAKGGKRVKTIEQVLSIIDTYLPQNIKSKIKRPRRRAVSIYLLNYIPRLIKTKDTKGFFVFTKAFYKYNRSPMLFGRFIRFIFQYKKFT